MHSIFVDKGTMSMRFRYHAFYISALTAALTVFCSSCQPGLMSKKAIRKTYTRAEQQHLIPFDALIVPGIPYYKGGWDPTMKTRVLWSWILYKNGYVRNIIYSGGAVYTRYYEAHIMGLYGQALGIPKEHIFYDTLARHSTENIYYSYLLAKKRGFKSIAVGTDPGQSRLLRGFTRKRFGSPIYHLPCNSDSVKYYSRFNPKIDPRTAKVTDTNWRSIMEQESFWKRLRGTLGKGIDFSKHPNGKVEAL